MSQETTVRLLFVDNGRYHHEEISIPTDALGRHERLIDCLREEPDVLKRVFLDTDRLCSARVVDAGTEEG
ncbi:MAG: hypothetical protein BMS9Abin29_0450 [Gemmatimonadota bacterium]|nr:MAG: hypothetical protein BMS9Abin29_0450 [Gemmatimonadota bacterium]